MNRNSLYFFLVLIVFCSSCSSSKNKFITQSTLGKEILDTNEVWLTHEHVLVDFIGADSIQPKSWNHDSIMKVMLPYFDALSNYKVKYFVDATPNYLGRDVLLLNKITKRTGITIITNTGFYGARNNKYIPKHVLEMSPEEISEIWVSEFNNGIDGTSIKPGFIKIGVDNNDPLHPIHQKLVKAAALTHLKTGLTIASHTGKAKGFWPQINILKQMNVSPQAFIWVHAQEESEFSNYIKAAKEGCWISLDGLGWEIDKHIEKLILAKKNKILDRILISHDAGWYDPQKKNQDIKPYTNLFDEVIPKLKSSGFTTQEINLLIRENPTKAFSLGVKKYGN